MYSGDLWVKKQRQNKKVRTFLKYQGLKGNCKLKIKQQIIAQLPWKQNLEAIYY